MESLLDGYVWLLRNNFWINMLFAVFIVFFQRKNPTSTWLWFMVIIFLPGIGFILYLFIGQDFNKKRMFQLKKKDNHIREKALFQGNKIKNDMYKFSNPKMEKYKSFINMHVLTNQSYFSEDNEIELYFSGKEKFDALLESISKAKRYIYLEYYIVRSDNIGRKLIEALIEKVKEGVEVKFLYDGMGGRKIAKDYFKQFKKEGGKVAVFFPPFLSYLSLRINYRNHRKICIIDGEEAYVGGFNIGDEYLGLSKKFGFWRDTHLKIRGSAVEELEWRFIQDWKFAAKSDDINFYVDSQAKKSNGKAGVQIVSSGPDSQWASIKDGYFNMITKAKKRIYIQTPYFIPDDSIYDALKVAGLSGVDVKIMIPCKPDHPFVYWAGLSYIGDLLKAGVKFYTYENGFLHSKTFIMDDFVTSIGTANVDIRSFKLNFEVNAFIYDEEINRKMVEQFNVDLKFCKEITPEIYKNRSNLIKLKESFCRLLSPIL